MPGDDAAQALVETVSALAGLATIPSNQVTPVAQVIKTGLDGIFRLDATKLRLGVNDTLVDSAPLRSGFYVGIAAAGTEIDLSRLWLRDGRLITGRDPIAGGAFTGHDYMVIQIERSERFPNWPALPGMSEIQQRFNNVLADELLSPKKKRERLRQLWPTFTQTIENSPHLVRADGYRILNDVAHDLTARLNAQETGNPFETKAWRGEDTVARSPATIDFAEVAEYEDPKDDCSSLAVHDGGEAMVVSRRNLARQSNAVAVEDKVDVNRSLFAGRPEDLRETHLLIEGTAPGSVDSRGVVVQAASATG